MLGCTALRGLLAVSCLAVTPAVIPGVLAADPPGVEHQQAMAVAPDLSQGTFQVMPASEVVPVTLPASAAPIWQGAQAFWQKRWRADTASLKRLHVDGARTGPVLTLPLEEARVIRFNDEIGSCAGFMTCVSHHLEDYLADKGYYVISVEHGEGGWAYLVDRKSGVVSVLVAPPTLSQDRKLAIAWYPSMMEGPKLDVLHFNVDGAEIEEAVVEGPCWPKVGQADATWMPVSIDADTIGLSRTDRQSTEMVSDISLKRIDGTWQMVCHP